MPEAPVTDSMIGMTAGELRKAFELVQSDSKMAPAVADAIARIKAERTTSKDIFEGAVRTLQANPLVVDDLKPLLEKLPLADAKGLAEVSDPIRGGFHELSTYRLAALLSIEPEELVEWLGSVGGVVVGDAAAWAAFGGNEDVLTECAVWLDDPARPPTLPPTWTKAKLSVWNGSTVWCDLPGWDGKVGVPIRFVAKSPKASLLRARESPPSDGGNLWDHISFSYRQVAVYPKHVRLTFGAILSHNHPDRPAHANRSRPSNAGDNDAMTAIRAARAMCSGFNISSDMETLTTQYQHCVRAFERTQNAWRAAIKNSPTDLIWAIKTYETFGRHMPALTSVQYGLVDEVLLRSADVTKEPV
jgi:hypothetical protein